MYKVFFKKKVEKMIRKIPFREQKRFANLVEDLETSGPAQPSWPNYCKLGANEYHCHLSYHWVACWSEIKSGVEIEVYYAGSREKAPY